MWPMLRVLVNTADGQGNLARDVRRVFLQTDRQLGQRCPPCLLGGRRQAQRVLGSHSVQGLGYWSGQDSQVLASLVEKNAGDVSSFAENSTAALGCQAQLLCQARHQGRLDAGPGWGVAHQKRKAVERFSWNVLGSHSAERHLFGLVEKDTW